MKKLCVLAVAMLMVAGVQAKDMTKEKFLAAQQKRAEAAGKTFDKAKAEAMFAKKDLNKDGVLSADEMKPGEGQKKKKSTEE